MKNPTNPHLNPIDLVHQRTNQLRFLARATRALARFNQQVGVPSDFEDELWAAAELTDELIEDLVKHADQLFELTRNQS